MRKSERPYGLGGLEGDDERFLRHLHPSDTESDRERVTDALNAAKKKTSKA